MDNLKLKELLQGKLKKVEREVEIFGETLTVVVKRLSAGQITKLTTIQQKSIKIKHMDEKTKEIDFDLDFENVALNDLEYKATAVHLGISDLFDSVDDAADIEEEDLDKLFELVSDVNGLSKSVEQDVKDFREK